MTIITAPRMVLSPPPQVILPGPPGVIAINSFPGAEYQLGFIVAPHAGVVGVKRWEFAIAPLNAKVVVVANLIDPTTPDSE